MCHCYPLVLLPLGLPLLLSPSSLLVLPVLLPPGLPLLLNPLAVLPLLLPLGLSLLLALPWSAGAANAAAPWAATVASPPEPVGAANAATPWATTRLLLPPPNMLVLPVLLLLWPSPVPPGRPARPLAPYKLRFDFFLPRAAAWAATCNPGAQRTGVGVRLRYSFTMWTKPAQGHTRKLHKKQIGVLRPNPARAAGPGHQAHISLRCRVVCYLRLRIRMSFQYFNTESDLH